MKLAERGGTGTYAPDLERQFRQSLASSPERPPLEVAVELARNIWPSILLDWSSASCDEEVRADQREIESALLAKKDLLRYSAEALFIAEAHLHRPSEPDQNLLEKYGKPLSHLILVNHRDCNSFHDEDPFASVPIPSLEYFGSAYGLGGNGSSFKRYVGLANLFWPILKKHSAFIAGPRGKRPILVGVFHPEDPVPVLGNIEFPRRGKS